MQKCFLKSLGVIHFLSYSSNHLSQKNSAHAFVNIRSRRSMNHSLIFGTTVSGRCSRLCPSPKEDIIGLFDSLKNMFAHHEHHHGASIGQSLTLADAKAILAFIVVHQQLADMRKVADAVKQLQDEMPQYITFGMSHYYSEPKRVRFQSEGGKFIDADAIATAFAETTVLQNECEIQHLMGDIEDNREHRDPAKTPAVPIDELVRVTNERLATGNDEERSRAWLFALFDQLDDIAEATKNNLEPLVTALDTTLQNSSATIGNSATTDAGNSSNNANAGDARSRIISLIADALFPAAESSQTSEYSASAAIRELMLNPTATSLDYMPAIDVLRAHGLTICR